MYCNTELLYYLYFIKMVQKIVHDGAQRSLVIYIKQINMKVNINKIYV